MNHSDRGSSDRLIDWCSYKCSIAAAINQDIPIRLFDALLAGQIPLVASDTVGLDQVIPASEWGRLPIVFYERNNVASVTAGHRRAIEIYDREGIEGARRRSAYAREHHIIRQRLTSLAERLAARMSLAAQNTEGI